jgi:hypothetical protein
MGCATSASMAAIRHAEELLIGHISEADFGWVADIWSPTGDAPGQLVAHRTFVARLRLKGIMPAVWVEGPGTGPAPIKPPIDVPDHMTAPN